MDLVVAAQEMFRREVDAAVARILRAGWRGDVDGLQTVLTDRQSRFVNPNVQRFLQSYLSLPQQTVSNITVDEAVVTITGAGEGDDYAAFETALRGLIPWRKGPYSLFGVSVDAEWRSDQKWDRIAEFKEWFHHRRVLDIGCNSGYYMFRLLAHDPQIVVGVDPSDLFFFQFHSLFQWMQDKPLAYLPIGLEQLCGFDHWFDTILCMGILYHQRSPIEALRGLRNVMKNEGTLILETLILNREGDYSITPKSTYAKMANVFYLPTLDCLLNWLNRAGFRRCRVLDVSRTTDSEQRRTQWVNTESLADFLDPNDPTLTVEGYPCPYRAVIACHRL